MVHTQETYCADIINRGYDPSRVGGDGVPLFSDAHPLWAGGTFSNRLETGASLSETAIESVCVNISRFVDDRMLPILVKPQRLLIPPELRFEAHRIMRPMQRPGTADNDTNAIRDLNVLPKGFAINHRFVDPDAWAVTTDCPHGLKYMKRTAIKRGIEGDFETGNMRYKSRMRFSPGWTNPRGVFGSPG